MRNDKVWLRVSELGGGLTFFGLAQAVMGDEADAGYWKQAQIQEGI